MSDGDGCPQCRRLAAERDELAERLRQAQRELAAVKAGLPSVGVIPEGWRLRVAPRRILEAVMAACPDVLTYARVDLLARSDFRQEPVDDPRELRSVYVYLIRQTLRRYVPGARFFTVYGVGLRMQEEDVELVAAAAAEYMEAQRADDHRRHQADERVRPDTAGRPGDA